MKENTLKDNPQPIPEELDEDYIMNSEENVSNHEIDPRNTEVNIIINNRKSI